jgi:hypothetical protein
MVYRRLKQRLRSSGLCNLRKLFKFYPDQNWRDSLNRPRPTTLKHVHPTFFGAVLLTRCAHSNGVAIKSRAT